MTLVEIMVVVGIIVILVAVFVPLAKSVTESGRVSLARAQLAQIETALDAYQRFWRPLISSSVERQTFVDTDGDAIPDTALHMQGLPPLSFDDTGGIVWDSYRSGGINAKLVAGGRLWVGFGVASKETNRPSKRFEKSSAWAFLYCETRRPCISGCCDLVDPIARRQPKNYRRTLDCGMSACARIAMSWWLHIYSAGSTTKSS